MVGKNFGITILATAFCLCLSFNASAQRKSSGQTDSLVRLISAESIELIEKDGLNYRKTVRPTFLHNGTYLICDTALWSVEQKLINCWGNVKLMQEETILTSDKLDYLVDEDLAQFRGTTVQLKNKENNTLRTRYLDYNTRDSVALFYRGAAMRDADGQIVESWEGNYYSSRKLFEFRDDVNMFTDSVFVKTSKLNYKGAEKKVEFPVYIDFWKDGNMLSASSGWYNRDKETFFFKDNVHALTRDQECWSDTLYYYRKLNDVLMLGHAQIQDTTRNATSLGGYVYYCDSLSRLIMQRDAAVALRTEQDSKIDTLYFGADSISYWAVKMCDIPDYVLNEAKTRIAEMDVDPVQEYRRKAAEAAAKAAEEAAQNDPNLRAKAKADEIRKQRAGDQHDQKAGGHSEPPAGGPAGTPPEGAPKGQTEVPGGPEQPGDTEHPKDSTHRRDSLSQKDSLALKDSLGIADSLKVEQKDTTKIGFLLARGRVRAFRKDMQLLCDSLRYCDLDSIGRFYIDPIIWNEGNRQYSADSVAVLIRGGKVDRAALNSNAFIITQEDSLRFDQIKSTEATAFFDENSNLKRFDALGGANALFYLKEHDQLATVNKVESKMISATMKNGETDRIYYYDSPKNDAYPVVQLPESEQKMKGFNWQPDLRPKSPEDITPLKIKPGERSAYLRHPEAEFRQTEIFFPGYMTEVHKGLAEAKRRRQEAREAAAREDSLKQKAGQPDSLFTISEQDSLKVTAARDSLKNSAALAVNPADTSRKDSSSVNSLKAAADSSKITSRDTTLSKAQLREQTRQKRIAARDSVWAAKDLRDSLKLEAKKLKALQRKRAATKRALIRQMKQDARDSAKLERYIEMYKHRKSKEKPKERPEMELLEGEMPIQQNP